LLSSQRVLNLSEGRVNMAEQKNCFYKSPWYITWWISYVDSLWHLKFEVLTVVRTGSWDVIPYSLVHLP
jgi:hypothetical protein